MNQRIFAKIGLLTVGLLVAISIGTSAHDRQSMVETKAAASSFTITRSSFPAGVLSSGTTDTWSTTSSDGTTITGGADLVSTASQTTMEVTSSSYPRFFTSTPLTGAITSITIACSSLPSARFWIPYLSATTPLTLSNYSSSGTTQGQKYLSNYTTSISWTVNSSSNFRYLYLDTTATGSRYLDSITITYLPSLTSLSASDSKTSYYVDDAYSKSTITATAHFSDASSLALAASDYSTSIAEGYHFTSTDYLNSPITVTLSYTSSGTTKTTTLSYTLIDRSLSSIALDTSSIKSIFETGETFSSSGLVVTAHYADSTTQTVSTYTTSLDGKVFSDIDLGSQSVLVTYTSEGVTVTATYSISVMKSAVWKHTFASGNPASGTANGGSFTVNSLTFNVRMTPLLTSQTAPIVSSFNTDKGNAYGSISNPVGILSLISPDFSSPTSGKSENGIYQVRVNASTESSSAYNSGYASIAVYVGGVLGSCSSTTLTGTPTDFIFDFSTPVIGKIELLLSNTNSVHKGSIFLKSIAVYANLLDASETATAQANQAQTFDSYAAGLATCSLSTLELSTLIYRYNSLTAGTQSALAPDIQSKYHYILSFYASSLNNVTTNASLAKVPETNATNTSLVVLMSLQFIASGLYFFVTSRNKRKATN